MQAYSDRVKAGFSRSLDGDIPVHSGVSQRAADALTWAVQHISATSSLEIGMAHGLSSLVILEASPENNLLSIDPVQTEVWKRSGVNNVSDAGFADRHTLVEEPDFVALPNLLQEGREFDLVFIDGWHSFDFTLLDAFYADRLTKVGGLIGFNDCHMPAIQKVLRFITTHWPWLEEQRRPRQRKGDDRYFLKGGTGQVRWDEFHRF